MDVAVYFGIVFVDNWSQSKSERACKAWSASCGRPFNGINEKGP